MLTRPARLWMVAVQTVALTVLVTAFARADFKIDPNPGGDFLYINGAQTNVSSLTGDVGSQNSGVLVGINTVANVDAANGYATFKPVGSTDLTSMLFTPANGDQFGSFSFRGQLDSSANGTVTVTVLDNQGHSPQTFTFTGLGANSDFNRIGITEVVPPGGESIQWVKIDSVFKEVKQVDFANSSLVGPPVPEPAFYQMSSLLLLGGLGLLRRRKRA